MGKSFIRVLTNAVAAMALVSLSVVTDGHAQGGDRAQVMNRVIDGINSADPVMRMVTFEQAMATKDRNIQRMALSAAFSSSDLALRTAAMEAAFAAKSSFIVEFTGLGPGTTRRDYWDDTAGRLEVWISGFDRETGNFEGRTNYSYKANTTNEWTMGPGNLSGDRLSFTVDVYKLGGGGTKCSGVMVADPGSTVMSGSMSCNAGTGKFTYTIKADFLR